MYTTEQVLSYQQQLINTLVQQQTFRSTRVRDAFTQVRRDHFLSHCYIHGPQGWQVRTFPPAADAHEWLSLLYADQALVTKLDQEQLPISSSSQPSIMATMLEALAIQPGQRVLEIGTGTGYNAALLSVLTGHPQCVTTIDIDGELVSQAARILERTVGKGMTVVVGDGFTGYAAHAPYDRIIATASHYRVPDAWLEQLRPGGMLVMNLLGRMAGGFLCLTKEADGSAHGYLIDMHRIAFMAMQQGQKTSVSSHQDPYHTQPIVEQTSITPQDFHPRAIEKDYPFRFFVQCAFPQAYFFNWFPSQQHASQLCIVDPASESSVWFTPDTSSERWQGTARGKERLLSSLQNTYRTFQQTGRPGFACYRYSIDQHGTQSLILYADTERHDALLTWLLPV